MMTAQAKPAMAVQFGSVATEKVRYPPTGLRRFMVAYWLTFRIMLGYLFHQLMSRFRSQERSQALLRIRHRRNARRILRTLLKLQGLFIKVGQLISIMTNFLPEELRTELESLQDRVSPRPYADIEKRLKEEFHGRSLDELFLQLDKEPVASASIGQVHRARLLDGTAVAVKVQHLDIDEIVRIDLQALQRIFRIISYFIPYHGLDQVYREIRDMVMDELDFRQEAKNVERIAANFTGRTDVRFPRVHADYSTGRVLTTDWIDASKISDKARLEALGVDRSKLARQVVQAYCQQIFSDGVYHADPHPGNILVERDGAGGFAVVFIDFGAVAEISPRMRRGIADLIQAAVVRDTPRLAQALKDMGFIARGADPVLFDRVVDFLHERFQEEIRLESFSLKDVKFDPAASLENLADLRKMNVSLRDLVDHFHVPKEWILLERTVLLLMGLCTELDPTLNPMEVIRPYVEEFVLGKDRDLSGLFLNTSKEVGSMLLSLPAEMKKMLRRLERGELEVRFIGLEEQMGQVYSLGRQVLWAALTLGLGGFALAFWDHGWHDAADYTVYAAGGSLIIFCWNWLTAPRQAKRRRRIGGSVS